MSGSSKLSFSQASRNDAAKQSTKWRSQLKPRLITSLTFELWTDLELYRAICKDFGTSSIAKQTPPGPCVFFSPMSSQCHPDVIPMSLPEFPALSSGVWLVLSWKGTWRVMRHSIPTPSHTPHQGEGMGKGRRYLRESSITCTCPASLANPFSLCNPLSSCFRVADSLPSSPTHTHTASYSHSRRTLWMIYESDCRTASPFTSHGHATPISNKHGPNGREPEQRHGNHNKCIQMPTFTAMPWSFTSTLGMFHPLSNSPLWFEANEIGMTCCDMLRHVATRSYRFKFCREA